VIGVVWVAVRYGLEVFGFPVRLPSLLDSSPFRPTLESTLDWSVLDAHLAGNGRIGAVAVSATDTSAGRTAELIDMGRRDAGQAVAGGWQ
jgi:NTE family protein